MTMTAMHKHPTQCNPRKARAGALVIHHPGGSSHRWVLVNKHSAPVPSRREAVGGSAPTTSTTQDISSQEFRQTFFFFFFLFFSFFLSYFFLFSFFLETEIRAARRPHQEKEITPPTANTLKNAKKDRNRNQKKKTPKRHHF